MKPAISGGSATAIVDRPRGMPATLRFGVLGPLAVWRGGGTTRVAAAKHRSVPGAHLPEETWLISVT